MAWEFSVKYDVRMGGGKRSVSICFKALFKKKGGDISYATTWGETNF